LPGRPPGNFDGFLHLSSREAWLAPRRHRSVPAPHFPAHGNPRRSACSHSGSSGSIFENCWTRSMRTRSLASPLEGKTRCHKCRRICRLLLSSDNCPPVKLPTPPCERPQKIQITNDLTL
jgi:hypothetical protein